MRATVGALAELVGGEVRGDGHREIDGANSVRKAGPTEITFAADEQNLKRLATSHAAAAIVTASHADRVQQERPGCALIVAADPQGAFIRILCHLRPQPARETLGISPHAHIHPTAKIASGCNIHATACIGADVEIGADCDIYPGVVIGQGCRIGEGTILFPHAVLYHGVTVGRRVIIHAGAVLGADGFGYRFQKGRFEKIPHLGSVQVEDDVEIGACTTIDRGMIGPTIIGEGTKLDNLVQIAHNCEIGKHNAFASQVGFAGSVTTGDYVRCGGQAGASGHIHLGTGSTYGGRTAIHRDMPAGGTYLGEPAMEERETMKIVMAQRKLPELKKQVRDLEQRLEELTRQMETVLQQLRPSQQESAA